MNNAEQFNDKYYIDRCEWRLIPDTNGYYASTMGNVRGINRFGQFTSKGHDEGRNYKSTYKVTSLIDSLGNSTDHTTHSLVCAAFHGRRPEGLVCNHKNSRKHDNRPSNLEWITPSENNYHAVDSGRIGDAMVIYATNVTTGEQKKFNSLRQFSKHHNTHNAGGLNILSRHQDKPDIHGYTYEIISGSLNTKNSKSIIYRDYRNHRAKRRIYMAKSLSDASYMTKTKYSMLTSKVNSCELVNGRCYFEFTGVEPAWPEFKPREVIASVDKYKRLGSTIVCFDPLSNSTITAESYLAMSNALMDDGVSISTDSISKVLMEDELRLCRGLLFKYQSDDRSWPELTEGEVKVSRRRDYARKGYEVKDYKTDRVINADNLSSLVSTISLMRSKKLHNKTVGDKLDSLYAGCVFRATSDDEWSKFTSREIDNSINSFYSNQRTNSKAVILKDYVTGKIHEAKGVTDMCRLLSNLRPINISSLEKLYRSKGSKCTNGYVIFKKDDFVKWSEFTNEEVSASVKASILGTGRAFSCMAVKDNVYIKADTVVELCKKLKDIGVKCAISSIRSRVIGDSSRLLSGWTITKV